MLNCKSSKSGAFEDENNLLLILPTLAFREAVLKQKLSERFIFTSPFGAPQGPTKASKAPTYTEILKLQNIQSH